MTYSIRFLAPFVVASLCGAATGADMSFTPASGSGVVINAAPDSPALRVLPAGGVQLPGLPATPASATSVVCHDAAGTLQRCDASAITGPQGAQGPQGPAGAQGPQGAQGVAGPAGPTGPSGAAGSTGSAGAIGQTGPAGAAGADGGNGKTSLLLTTAEPAGANCAGGGQRVDAGLDTDGDGSLGTAEITKTTYVCNGAPGSKGDTGTTGAQGTKGDTGATGSTGATGAQGPKGDQGVQGPQGLQGPKGNDGAGGVTGAQELRHGCFDGSGAVLTGAGFSVAKSPATNQFTVTLTPAMSAASYTVLLDGRASSGRALGLKTPSVLAGSIVLSAGWIDPDLETISSICFLLSI